MNRLPALIAVAITLLCVCATARADVFALGPGLTNLETVVVGNAGNAGDARYGSANRYYGLPSYGSVGYAYHIAKYEVTAAQYCDFLNHKAQSDPYGLYNTLMDTAAGIPNSEYGCNIKRDGAEGSYTYSLAANWANRPVNYVSFWDACRFSNWLNNGQGDGDTETGAYTLNGYNGADGEDILRSASWTWAVASEDEWYKAAYYNRTNGNYWDYPTQSYALPSNVGSDAYTDPGNHANYWLYHMTIGTPYYRTNVGEFENSASAYGTFDQGGNLWEWNETNVSGSQRDMRGGSFGWTNVDYLSADSFRLGWDPSTEDCKFGFRVVRAVPEPASVVAFVWGLASLLGWRRRKA